MWTYVVPNDCTCCTCGIVKDDTIDIKVDNDIISICDSCVDESNVTKIKQRITVMVKRIKRKERMICEVCKTNETETTKPYTVTVKEDAFSETIKKTLKAGTKITVHLPICSDCDDILLGWEERN